MFKSKGTTLISLFVVIPVHNRKEFTRNCLDSLRKQTYQDFKIIVINDGSTDGTKEMLANEFPEVEILAGDGNLWWTKATNLGIKLALENGTDYILTLNNDTIAEEDFIEKMLYWTEKTPNALLGAFALDAETKMPVYGGEIINWLTAGNTKLLDIIEIKNRKGLHEVTHFPGRGLFIPSKVFTDIGVFNEKDFPHYLADYDFTHRVKMAGYKIFCNYDAKILIYSSVSGSQELRNNKNIIKYYNHLFGRKGGGNIKLFIIYAFNNCPNKYLLPFLLCGLIRRIFGYLLPEDR
jgi:GT2 family glycosyltransferase